MNESRKKQQTVSKSYLPHVFILAGVSLVTTLTVVTFFQNEFDAVVASMESGALIEEVSNEMLADEQNAEFEIAESSINAEKVPDENVPVAVQPVPLAAAPVQPATIFQPPMLINQNRAPVFNAVGHQYRPYQQAMGMPEQRHVNSARFGAVSFESMNQKAIDMQNKMHALHIKTQQIQLETQQKLQAAYKEFHTS